jgi:hypothetical protein
MIYAVLIRRLRPGATFEQFRSAWLPDRPYEVPVRVANARRVDDPRELLRSGAPTSPALTCRRSSSASPRARPAGTIA